MPISHQARLPRLAGPALWTIALSVMLLASGEASAEGFFDALFGGNRSHATPALPFADPSTPTSITVTPAIGSGRVVAFCVRLCDGRFFPIQRHTGATPIQTCNALCPAAKTKIFTGSEIARATASDGRRYGDLDNAFVYRQKVIPDCSCNGTTTFGLAPMDIADDPTLRAGDLVATKDGLQKFTGSQTQLRKGNGFTPVKLGEATAQRRRVATTGAAMPN